VESKPENKYAKIILYTSMAMSAFYLVMGAMLIFTNIFNIYATNKLILGGALICYGIFRFYRIITKYKSEKTE
jgi:hypothetical protein